MKHEVIVMILEKSENIAQATAFFDRLAAFESSGVREIAPALDIKVVGAALKSMKVESKGPKRVRRSTRSKRWSINQDRSLIKMRAAGTSWKIIAADLGRSAGAAAVRFYKLRAMDGVVIRPGA